MNTAFKSTKLEVLVVAPHPDDAEIFCGGMIARFTHLGYKVGVLDVSEAELSSMGSVSERRMESAEASKVLNLAWRRNLSLPNCCIFDESTGEKDEFSQSAAVRGIVEAIRGTNPEILVVPTSEDRHPDHVQVSKLCHRAVFMAGLRNYKEVGGKTFSPDLVVEYQFRTEFVPSFVVDISDYVETKYQAIDCYRTQVATAAGEAPTLLSSRLCIPAFRARDAHIGAMIGVAFGEGYKIKNPLRVDDIIAHSRANPIKNALFFRN